MKRDSVPVPRRSGQVLTRLTVGFSTLAGTGFAAADTVGRVPEPGVLQLLALGAAVAAVAWVKRRK